MHHLTKTDFKYYLDCPESIWLLKNKPDVYPKGEFSLFTEKLIKEGYEVEAYAKKLFTNGLDLPEYGSPTQTQKALTDTYNVYFQPSFNTNKDVFARIDILERLADGTWHIYEVKSSTSIKKDRKHRHIEDACFQKYVLTECGYVVSKVSIIHLNKEYIKKGAIIPNELLEIIDITDDVDTIYSSVVNEINSASNFINKEIINETVCSCTHKTRSNHCDAFRYFNTTIPDYSIYEISRISAKKVGLLADNEQLAIIDIPPEFELNVNQQTQVESVRQEQPIINQANIKRELDKLKFPLHFIDYETYASAIPRLDGLSPHKHVTFQVSIHTLTEDGSLTHYEFLLDEMKMPIDMLQTMQDFTGLTGTFISWHASFEISRNKDLIEWLPQFTNYLTYINEHTFDLETIFKKDYIDYRFHGSSSIKKVLPVICPHLSYSELDVYNGTMALDTWGRMVLDPNFNEDIETTKINLLEYCKLDTMAMVEIYKFLIDCI
ncbi:MAG: DUF2779 domain-containing protein [Algibacter sp.]|uniref:DUF2779 domain-containing protein n=1 Tax=Algibacter sp. TaxID=1872428 RepID=UPI00260C4677|nr:DUF2779 domain-containing protein [Algibacter sp.]MDG1728973.1 DUF2779 domain-containing protein [Algibacter sp.]MDG2177211.1 DUF2779 domain-containing protein [Algibacter sp.]